jgi:hypothetical protein
MNLNESLPLIRFAAESLDSAESPKQILDLVLQGKPYDEMFFSSLSDTRWIPLLKEAGFFCQLPKPQTDAEGATRFPRSLPLIGLTQLAKDAPAAIIEILENLPESQNPQVDDQIMRCIARIQDAALAPRCLPILERLLAKSDQNEWIWIEEILKTWMNLGRASEVISLIGTYLNTHIRRQENRYGAGTGWQFSEIDRDVVEPLIASHPTELGSMFFEALGFWKMRQQELTAAAPSAVDNLFGGPEEIGEQGPSTYWLEDFKNRTSRIYELEETLATRLYEIGASIFSGGDDRSTQEFDNMLRSDSWELFARLRWQLYADHPERTLEWARADFLLRIPTLGHSSNIHGFEMAQMLESHSMKHGSSFLTQAEIGQIYAIVMAGPIDDEGNRETEERFITIFHRKQLQPIRSLLTGQALATYQDLAKDQPELPASSYKPFSSGGGEARTIEHVAPKQADHLAEMSDGEIWEFLNTWKPEGNRFNSDQWWVEEHVSALGLKFADLLDAEPDRFQASEEWWRNVTRPVVLYKPLERAAARISSDSKGKDEAISPSENEWRNWFGLAACIADWGGEPAGEERLTEDTVRPEDRDWNWPRIVTVKFLATAINPRFQLPEDLKPEIGRLLHKFLEDPDPRLASKDKPMLEDWLTTAINSVRGTALEDILQLALHQKKESSTQQPEDWIWQAIRTALCAENQSPAVFAIMGARLHPALYLYSENFRQEPGLLMPEGNFACRNAFILAHVRYGNSLGALLKILPDFPAAALDCLAELNSKEFGDREQQIGDFGGRLGTHLAFYYWNDAFPSRQAAEQTMERYFEIADPNQRAKAIGDVARIFSEASPIEEHRSLYQRVMELWEYRFSVITAKRRSGTYTAEEVHEELSAFVRWLGCGCFPFEWRHEHVLKAIHFLEGAPQAVFTLRTLTALSSETEKIGPCLEILEALLSKESEVVSWIYQDDEIKPLLTNGLKSENHEILERSRRIQETLLRHGLFSYLNLVED